MIYSLDIEDEQEIILKKENYPNLLADVVVEIKGERVRVKEEESPLNYCSIQGWVARSNHPIVCLPNSLLIVIEGKKQVDYDMVIFYE